MMDRIEAGFSQRIRLEWLELTAQLVLLGLGREEIRNHLREELRAQLSVGADPLRGNRDKAITILLRTWVTPRSELREVRDEGLAHLDRLALAEHLPVHWGMVLCAYPFFGTVADAVGRLVRLNGSVAARQVQRQLREQLGERETIARATRRILRALIDWGVLADTSAKGLYTPADPHVIHDPALRAWLIEAALRASQVRAVGVSAIAKSPMLFPFSLIPVTPTELDSCSRLEWFRHGLDIDMVAIRRQPNRGTTHASESPG